MPGPSAVPSVGANRRRLAVLFVGAFTPVTLKRRELSIATPLPPVEPGVGVGELVGGGAVMTAGAVGGCVSGVPAEAVRMMSWGRLATVAPSGELKKAPSVVGVGPTTRVTLPSPLTSGVTSHSARVPAGRAPTSAVAVSARAGRVFQVRPVSVQLAHCRA